MRATGGCPAQLPQQRINEQRPNRRGEGQGICAPLCPLLRCLMPLTPSSAGMCTAKWGLRRRLWGITASTGAPGIHRRILTQRNWTCFGAINEVPMGKGHLDASVRSSKGLWTILLMTNSVSFDRLTIPNQSTQRKIQQGDSSPWKYLSKQPTRELISSAGVEQPRQKNAAGAALTRLRTGRGVGGADPSFC